MVSKDLLFTVSIINYNGRDGSFIVEGELSGEYEGELICEINGAKINIKSHKNGWHKVSIPAQEDIVMKFKVQLQRNKETIPVGVRYNKASRIGSIHSFSYRMLNKTIFIPGPTSLEFNKASLRRIAWREIVYFMNSLIRDSGNKHNLIKTIAIEPLRIAAILRSTRKSIDNIWLFSDRDTSGGDNSEVLFRYISNRKPKSVKLYFVINKNTNTYSQLKKDGHSVVGFKTLRHLYLSMVADLILPSHLDDKYMYPWPSVWQKYSGLMKYRIIHTQHGLVVNDMSQYIGRRQKNAELFLSACEWEKKYLLSERYDYTPDQVPVTGLPRYDTLYANLDVKRIISIHPTWRSWLARNHGDTGRGVVDFTQSNYYRFYQNLINDKRIEKALKKADYTLRFYLHPNHRAQTNDYSAGSDQVKIMNFPYDYKSMLNDSGILVTDYSNVSFDFAYTRKPIIYTQFDKDDFFSKQESISKQFFDYKESGFGPVCTDYESSVNNIIQLIEAQGAQDKKYIYRADDFFTYRDAKNCERAYDAILKWYTPH